MHYRGKSAKFEVIEPDGKVKLVGWTPYYDFNWQYEYRLKSPLMVEKGSTLKMTLTYDNSKWNLMNPDPNKIVKWGRQSWSEMFYFEIAYIEYDD